MEELIEKLSKERRVPRATYRLQFNRGFTLRQGTAVVEYLRDLGISDVYASPVFKARSGSTHGYDVCAFNEVNPELGGFEAFDELSERLRRAGMGLLLDMVPNHMGINDLANAWWLDVLEKGRCSFFSTYFDIDWHPPNPDLEDRILLPFLGDPYGKVLERGELKLQFDGGAFFIACFDNRFPVSPRSYIPILRAIIASASRQGANDVAETLDRLSSSIREWPRSRSPEACPSPALNRAFRDCREELRSLAETSTAFCEALEAALARLNGTPGDPGSFDALDDLLQEQNYRLAFWRVGPAEINYRRFFEITELICLRAGQAGVFASTHQLVFRFLRENKITGLRIDHPDGLWNPEEYFFRLQEGFVLDRLNASNPQFGEAELHLAAAEWLARQARRARETASKPPDAPDEPPAGASSGPVVEPPRWPLYVVAEKILGEREQLPAPWAVYGTTGYDYTNTVNGLFVNGAARETFDRLMHTFAGWPHDFWTTVYRSKRNMMEHSLASELHALCYRARQVAARHRHGRDFVFEQLHGALWEIVATFPVYRTYLTDQSERPAPEERIVIEQAVEQAMDRRPDLPRDLFAFLRALLTLENLEQFAWEDRAAVLAWIMKFQQLTGPVMAKGLEDTAFYNHHRLISLNEVGGNPDTFGVSVEEFHRRNAGRRRRLPHSMLATATHDTKRGEDVRARINVLTEIPDDWSRAVERWSKMNAGGKTEVNGACVPDANDEYLLYQTLVGAWPWSIEGADVMAAFRDRVSEYMLKAARESKRATSWLDPNPGYEAALKRFVETVIGDGRNSFCADLSEFQSRTAFFGVVNSLAQTLLKLTSPGVPDLYQGTELWDLSLVDPDNRRPVDYTLRRRFLAEMKEQFGATPSEMRSNSTALGALMEKPADGRIKLYVVWRALQFRAAHPELFESGTYVPLQTSGPASAHLCAFARHHDCDVVVVTPRLSLKLAGGRRLWPVGGEIWKETAIQLPAGMGNGPWRNLFTGETVSASPDDRQVVLLSRDVLRGFPVAMLEREKN